MPDPDDIDDSLWDKGYWRPANTAASLAPRLKFLLYQQLFADRLLDKGYETLIGKSNAGKKVTGQGVAQAEMFYNLLMDTHEDRLKDAVAAVAEAEQKEHPSRISRALRSFQEKWPMVAPVVQPVANVVGRVERERLKKQFTNQYYTTLIHQDIEKLKNRPIGEPLEPDKIGGALNAAFERDYLAAAPHKEDTRIGENVNTVPLLIAELLSKNPGLVVGDIHTQHEPPRLIIEHMPLLKAMGVDTVYVEHSQRYQAAIAGLPDDELQTLIEKRHINGYKLHTPQEVAAAYGTCKADDVSVSWIELELAARRNGIRVVGIDTNGPAPGLDMTRRIQTTNFVWADNIREDRAHLARQGRDGGKFIEIGGLGHFTDDGEAKGRVDEALGIPVIAFDRMAEGGVAFVREYSKKGPDFYIPGGEDYHPSRALTRMEDIKNLAQKIKEMGQQKTTSGVPTASAITESVSRFLNDYAEKTEHRLYDQYRSQPPEPVTAAVEVEVPSTPMMAGGGDKQKR